MQRQQFGVAGAVAKTNCRSPKTVGKRNVSQILAHCEKPFEIAEQKIVIKRNLISRLFGRIMKVKRINMGEDFKTNVPAVKAFVANVAFDFVTD